MGKSEQSSLWLSLWYLRKSYSSLNMEFWHHLFWILGHSLGDSAIIFSEPAKVIHKYHYLLLHCPFPRHHRLNSLGFLPELGVTCGLFSLFYLIFEGFVSGQIQFSSYSDPTIEVHMGSIIPLCRSDDEMMLNGSVPNMLAGELEVVEKLKDVPQSVANCLALYHDHKIYSLE